jgi:hypothetical protein
VTDKLEKPGGPSGISPVTSLRWSTRPAKATSTPAGTARQARFGTLPERIRPEEMVAERAATMPDPTRTAYNTDEWLVRYCL